MTAGQQTLFGLLPTALALPAKKAAPRRKRKPRPLVAATAPVEYLAGVDADGRTVFTLRFPAPERMVSVNTVMYWRQEHAIKSTWREALFLHAKGAKLPTGLARVRLDFELRFPTNGARDAANYHPRVVKPGTDGLGPAFRQVITKGKRAGQVSSAPGYGLIADDTPEHLDGPHVTIGPKVADPKRCPFGEVIVTITDLSEVA